MAAKRTFREKLADDKDLPRVERIPPGMVSRLGEGTLLIPAPSEVNALMRRVRKGRVTTINDIRAVLAARHSASTTCPIVAGILARIAAGAAGEEEADGKRRVTPYWRTLKRDGELNPKYPGGSAEQARRLRAEGHRVVTRGKRRFVADFERVLQDLSAAK